MSAEVPAGFAVVARGGVEPPTFSYSDSLSPTRSR